MPHVMPDRTPLPVAIVDYGMGNLFSVQRACEYVGLHATITSEPRTILQAAAVILPGVGAFGHAMDALRRSDLVAPLHDVAAAGTPLIGICLGLQLMMSESSEFGRHRGLGLVEGTVQRLAPQLPDVRVKVPQVGWNRILEPADRPGVWNGTLLEQMPSGSYVYFVHSFYAQPVDPAVVLSVSSYGGVSFCSSLRKGNLVAFQFHPERSAEPGLRIYRNLAERLSTTGNALERK